MKHHSGQGKELRKNMYTGDTQTYHILLSQLNHSFRVHRKEKALHRDELQKCEEVSQGNGEK